MVEFGKYYSLYFPKVARNHRKYNCPCVGQGREASKEAKFDEKGNYVEGHFWSQNTAERAHKEGIR